MWHLFVYSFAHGASPAGFFSEVKYFEKRIQELQTCLRFMSYVGAV
jgi:hypothetical protein